MHRRDRGRPYARGVSDGRRRESLGIRAWADPRSGSDCSISPTEMRVAQYVLVYRPGTRMKSILDSRKLLAFVTLARCGSFTQTSRELFLTQSAVSHAIKSLEQELERRLFDRLGRKARLTPAGHRLLEYADRILDEMQHARADLVASGQPDENPASGRWRELAGG